MKDTTNSGICRVSWPASQASEGILCGPRASSFAASCNPCALHACSYNPTVSAMATKISSTGISTARYPLPVVILLLLLLLLLIMPMSLRG